MSNTENYIGNTENYIASGTCMSYPPYAILIEPDYSDKLLIPIALLTYLDDIKVVNGDTYSRRDLEVSNKKLKFSLVDTRTIKPAGPDAEVAKAKLEEHKAKLEEEMKAIEKEINSL